MSNINDITRSDRMNDEERKAYFKKGLNYLDQGKFKEALKVFDALVAMDRSSASSFYYKGNTLRHLGRHEEALECYERAIKISPNNGAYYYGKACSLYSLGDGTKGLEALQRAVNAGSQEETIYAKCNILSGFKKIDIDGRSKVLAQMSELGQQEDTKSRASKESKACVEFKERAESNTVLRVAARSLSTGDNYSFGFMR